MDKKSKILLLGWDAADWKVINPLVDKGLMPNMKRLIENGTVANLSSQDPMYSPMLWTSIATGKRPYKHGVLGFSEVSDDGKSVNPVMSTSRKCRAIWNILTLEDLTSQIVGWWPSHPVEKIKGTMISNFFQNHTGPITEKWPISKGTVHPEEKSEYYAQFRVHPNELTGNHILPFVPNLKNLSKEESKRLFSIAKITGHASTLHAAFTNIIQNEEWDFAALYLDAIDHYCHGFMKFHPPHRPHIIKSEYDAFKDVVVGGYRFHDMMLGRIMDLIDDETTLMLISDHGFQPDHLRPTSIPKEPAGPAYEHNPYGIIACMGPNIRKDHIMFGASQLDITPTLLHMMDLPVGKDMDGKVLQEMFENVKNIKYINSWEDKIGFDGRGKSFKDESEKDEITKSALKQLVDLGYIENNNDSIEQKIINTQNESDFNLARSYIDGGLISEAIPLLEKLYDSNKNISRYAFKLASCYQSVGRLSEAREVIQYLRSLENYNEATLDIIEGSLLIGENEPLKAIKLFKRAEKSELPNHSRIYMQLAIAYNKLKRYEDAEKCLLKEININPDLSKSHGLLGKIYYSQKKYSKSIKSLYTAIGLDFNNPIYHYGLGKAYYAQGEYFKAAAALENSLKIYPDNQRGRELLIEIYKIRLKDEEKFLKHRQIFNTKDRDIVYVVSGLPRSGTSMIMQMLQAGGLPIYTDNRREKDKNNPKGYYEHEAVKSIASDNYFISESINKVVKVVVPLVHHLPSKFKYKIVFIDRDINEIISSQQRMLKNLGKDIKEDIYPTQIADLFKKQMNTAIEWASKKSYIDYIILEHKEVIMNPFLSALKLNEFFDKKLVPEKMAEKIDNSLYREKFINMLEAND